MHRYDKKLYPDDIFLGATAAKFALEQRQREEAAQRKQTGAKWETKLFRLVGDNWMFNESLPKRIRDFQSDDQ